MLLTVKEKKELDEIIQAYLKYDNKIEWVSYDECFQYRNSQYENMLIGLGYGKHTSHVNKVSLDTELTYFYQKQILYFLTVFRRENDLQICVYKTNGNGLDGCHQLEKISVGLEA